MSPTAIVVFACSLAVSSDAALLEKQADQAYRRDLAVAVVRYMAANDDLEPDDLITRSQVRELQQYLRKTRGRTPLASPRVQKRVCPDKSRLSQFYHQEHGAVLRKAAGALGSYEQLDRLSATPVGRRSLQGAINSGSIAALLREIDKQKLGPRKSELHDAERGKEQLNPNRRIYTTRQLIEVYLEINLPRQRPPRQG